MKNKRRKRRLVDIETDEVSIVDIAANQRKFLIVKKQNKEEDHVDELKEVLEGIEKALNQLAKGQSVMAKAFAAQEEPEDDDADILTLLGKDVRKAGAKYSKANLGRLKGIRDSINSLLAGFDDDAGGDDKDDKKDTKKNDVSIDKVKDMLTAGIRKGMGLKEDDKPVEDNIDSVVKTLLPSIASALGIEIPEEK